MTRGADGSTHTGFSGVRTRGSAGKRPTLALTDSLAPFVRSRDRWRVGYSGHTGGRFRATHRYAPGCDSGGRRRGRVSGPCDLGGSRWPLSGSPGHRSLGHAARAPLGPRAQRGGRPLRGGLLLLWAAGKGPVRTPASIGMNGQPYLDFHPRTIHDRQH